MVASRAAETLEQTDSRLEEQRTRQATSRAVETPEQTFSRLEEQRTRQVTSRAAETPSQRQTRRNDDTQRCELPQLQNKLRLDVRMIEQDVQHPE
jgi:hypothetical protein